MKYLNLFFHFLLLSNIYIALCAVGLSIETSWMLHHGWQPISLYVFIFFATLFTYNLYYIQSTQFEFHKQLTTIGLIGSVISFFCIPLVSYFYLSIATFFTMVYALPVFLKIKIPEYVAFSRVLILIAVWFIITFILPGSIEDIDVDTLLFATYRIAFMGVLCFLFYRKDLKKNALKKIASFVIIFFNAVQLLMSATIAHSTNMELGITYIFMSIITGLVVLTFILKRKRTISYLAYVDGLMLLQSLFVFLFYYFPNASISL